MFIRPAGDGDLPALLAVTNHAILTSTALFDYEPRTPGAQAEWLDAKRAEGWPVFVAEDEGKFLGFASFGPFRRWPAYQHSVEHSVYVAEDAQRQGIGRQLLEALIDEAKRRGLHTMIGGIEASNARSLALHAALGFAEAGRMREVGWKFDRWLDLVFVQKILES